MSTLTANPPTPAPVKVRPPRTHQTSPPPLENGERLTQAEFMRRYQTMPHIKNAELIEGITYMASPVRATAHGEPHQILGGWIFYYLSKTAGLRSFDNATLRLDEDNVVQPDVSLCVPHHMGGGARIMRDDYLEGAPELVIEIAGSTTSIDLNAKLNAYRRNRVAEYLAWRTRDDDFDWFLWNDGQYDRQQPRDVDGRAMLVSRAFPGLWLDVRAAVEGDAAGVLAAVDRGVREDPEHAKLVGRLNHPQA